MTIKTTYSLLTRLLHAKRMTQRRARHLEAHLAYLVALVNVIVQSCATYGLAWTDFMYPLQNCWVRARECFELPGGAAA
jgi:hypothetical protein